MLDTSGAGLHKRGYRADATEAPIKGNACRWNGTSGAYSAGRQGVDPFCGSGTILIESALYALNIAPGLNRRFFRRKMGRNRWAGLAGGTERALDSVRHDAAFHAYGSDIDPEAVTLSLANAEKAGVSARVFL